MNAFQVCQNHSDLLPFYLPQQLFLKPIARINISLQLPNVKKLGKSVSYWEIMDKIKTLILPEEFTVLKVTKTSLEFVRFEAELEIRDKLERAISKIDNKMIKLKDFSELMRLRAAEWQSDFPQQRDWDNFFSNTKNMDEMKPGERPDTVHLSNLPKKWFVPYHLTNQDDALPSEKILYRIFEKFGSIRYVDIPICDPYRKKMKDHISGIKHSSFQNTEFFEGYVQFKDYVGFTKAMGALKDMKLVHKEDGTAFECNIKVEFDKNKHLSDASIRRREIVRDRLVKKAKEQEERDKTVLEEKKRKEEQERMKEVELKQQKALRRKLREEKRKAKILKKLEISGSEEINEKIAKEEKKLLKVQRKLEAIRLVEELFKRIQEKRTEDAVYDRPSRSRDELRNFKNSSELEVLNQKEKLHNAIKGRVMLKTILADKSKRRYSSSSSNSDISLDIPIHGSDQKPASPVIHKYPELIYEPPSWLGYAPYLHPNAFFPGAFMGRGRGFPRFPNAAGPSRGNYSRRRGYRHRGGGRGGNHYNQYDIDEDYRYHDDRSSHTSSKRSRNRSRSRSYSRSRRSYSRSRRSNSRSRRSYSRSYTRSRSRTRKRSRSRRSRSYRSRSKSRRSYTRSRTRSRSESRQRNRSRSLSRDKRKSRSKSKEKSKRDSSRRSSERSKRTIDNDLKGRSRSREKSVDSSTFITHKEFSERRARSKSWSLPKEGEADKSWSQSPEKKD